MHNSRPGAKLVAKSRTTSLFVLLTGVELLRLHKKDASLVETDDLIGLRETKKIVRALIKMYMSHNKIGLLLVIV